MLRLSGLAAQNVKYESPSAWTRSKTDLILKTKVGMRLELGLNQQIELLEVTRL